MLSKGNQGYQVVTPHTDTNFTAKPAKAFATANNVKVDPQFSDLGDIGPTHGNKGGAPAQPKVGYHVGG
jgi:hypothetical protein